VPRECCQPVGETIIIGHNASGITTSAQIFPWIKGKRSGVTKGSNISAVVLCEMRLGAIF
jgi:hypothetical protein